MVALTNEISELTTAKHFDIDLNGTIQRCRKLISDGHYSAIIGMYEDKEVAVATLTEIICR
ncbi:MAG: hypothetical protein QNK36_01760 [Colwellia sp.]|nr:hypothetical protein [Colwellia sp.]